MSSNRILMESYKTLESKVIHVMNIRDREFPKVSLKLIESYSRDFLDALTVRGLYDLDPRFSPIVITRKRKGIININFKELGKELEISTSLKRVNQ